jgi:methionine sulfoxide reductase heme-binding subunit
MTEITSQSMNPIGRIWHSRFMFWALLAIPAVPMIMELLNGSYRHLLHESGEFAARFTIFAMVLTPLVMLFPKTRALRWLMKRRRYIGVAAFGYAALHTLAYTLKEGTLARIIAELPQPGIWLGWVAMLLFVPLAVTSNDTSLRALGATWKTIQRLVYPAAILTVAHWYFLEYQIGPALVHFGPLAALEIYRIWKVNSLKRARQDGSHETA